MRKMNGDDQLFNQSITSLSRFLIEFMKAVSAAIGIAMNRLLQYYPLSTFLVPKNRVTDGKEKEWNHD